jgi:hypothetical protein
MLGAMLEQCLRHGGLNPLLAAPCRSGLLVLGIEEGGSRIPSSFTYIGAMRSQADEQRGIARRFEPGLSHYRSMGFRDFSFLVQNRAGIRGEMR